jgi:N-acetylglucosamine kinase-like BadF-type ATPase
MNYFIGIDGGGTKTKASLINENLGVISEGIGGPSNFLVFDINEVANSLVQLVLDVCEKGNIEIEKVKSILLGTAGAGRKDDAERLENVVRKIAAEKNVKINIFKVESDARIALEGAFSGKPGSILIAGTGSIMFGKDSKENVHRVGGFGRILGDEGSGFKIGLAGLSAIAKAFDKRNSGTLLTELIKNEFNINDSVQLINEVYKNNFDIPKIAPLVIKAAEENDKICKEIIDSQIDELVEHIIAMKPKINEETLSVSLIGGTITTDNYFATLFQSIAKKIPNVKIVKAELSPDVGAALMAKNNFYK